MYGASDMTCIRQMHRMLFLLFMRCIRVLLKCINVSYSYLCYWVMPKVSMHNLMRVYLCCAVTMQWFVQRPPESLKSVSIRFLDFLFVFNTYLYKLFHDYSINEIILFLFLFSYNFSCFFFFNKYHNI